MQKKTVYIAGQVSGLPYEEVYKKFKVVEFKLAEQGWYVLNPCDLCKADEEWTAALKTCIAALMTCDFIYMLPCWTKSKGARLERFIAGSVGMEIIEGE